jgi:hypothetical protein
MMLKLELRIETLQNGEATRNNTTAYLAVEDPNSCRYKERYCDSENN